MMPACRRYLINVSGLLSAIVFVIAAGPGFLRNGAQAAGLLESFSKNSTVQGFVRQRISMNLGDPAETPENDRYDLSMLRSTFYLATTYNWTSAASLTAISRLDWEYIPEYLRRLEDRSSRNLSGVYDEYEIRELYADLHFLNDRLFLRIGRQQVVWGKTDFFRGLDVIHGFDYRWRSFLEPENELLRKPLILVNVELQVPEWNGFLQLIVRPGFDRKKDIGNTYDIFGGRWAQQPNKGTDLLSSMGYNLDHSKGDRRDWTYGIRWSGYAKGIEYSLNYLRTFNNDPVVNAASSVGADPYGEAPENDFAEFIYPQVSLAGGTLNYYFTAIDTLVRCEFSYTWDQPYNYGRNFLLGRLPGFAGLIEKDTVRMMLAFDKNIAWAVPVLGACRPGFLNVQLFDTWITGYHRSDDIVAAAGYGAHIRRHNTIVTAVFAWNYLFDRINPQLAWGADLNNGSGFIIPSVQLVRGDHWRLRIEYDHFYNDNGKKSGEIETSARTFNFFDNNDQLYMRLTYQF